MSKDKQTQATEDALISMVMGRAAERGDGSAYRHLMAAAAKAGVEKKVEQSMDRHAARMRAAGEKGW